MDGIPLLINKDDQRYITGGNGVRINFSESFYGRGFAVYRRGPAGSCC